MIRDGDGAAGEIGTQVQTAIITLHRTEIKQTRHGMTHEGRRGLAGAVRGEVLVGDGAGPEGGNRSHHRIASTNQHSIRMATRQSTLHAARGVVQGRETRETRCKNDVEVLVPVVRGLAHRVRVGRDHELDPDCLELLDHQLGVGPARLRQGLVADRVGLGHRVVPREVVDDDQRERDATADVLVGDSLKPEIGHNIGLQEEKKEINDDDQRERDVAADVLVRDSLETRNGRENVKYGFIPPSVRAPSPSPGPPFLAPCPTVCGGLSPNRVSEGRVWLFLGIKLLADSKTSNQHHIGQL